MTLLALCFLGRYLDTAVTLERVSPELLGQIEEDRQCLTESTKAVTGRIEKVSMWKCCLLQSGKREKQGFVAV